jgi:hypothetical protein
MPKLDAVAIVMLTTAIISLICWSCIILSEVKKGIMYRTFKFTRAENGLPPKIYGTTKESVSDVVVVYLEAGPKDSKTVKFATDYYDYDLNRWSKFDGTAEEEFKVIKWAPLPKE